MKDVRMDWRLDGMPRWLNSPTLFALVAVLLALLLGLVTVKAHLLLLGLAAVGGVALVAALVRWPQLGPALFWLVYSLQVTVFAGLSVTGMYYPVYALMALNVVLALAFRRLVVGWRLIPYIVFLLVVLASLLPVVGPLDFVGHQRLFIYFIGFLVYFQFPTKSVPRAVTTVQVLSTLVIIVWVVVSSVQSGFGYRGNIRVDQNDVSFLMGFGLLAMLAQLAGRKFTVVTSVALWVGVGAGVYALLLLASRGISVAFAVAALTILGRSLLPARRSIPVLLAVALAGVVLVNLPGSDSLIVRFQGANVASANERLPLWKATIQKIEHSSPYELLLGNGFETSMSLIRRVSVTLTSTHNVYLELLYDLGLVGLAAFLAIHLTLLRRFWRTRTATTLYGASALVFMLMGDLTITASDNFLYWVAIGNLLAIAVSLDRREAAESLAARRALPAAGPAAGPHSVAPGRPRLGP